QKESNKKIEDELSIEVKSKEKTQKDLSALENASKQVSNVMQTLKKQFEDAKAELNINIDERNKAERLLEAEKTEHEKLKEDLEFLQGTTIGSEEGTERKIKAMEVEIPKEKELADEMNAEAQKLSESNKDLEDKIRDARVESLNKPQATNEVSDDNGASIGTSLTVKNLTKETEHTFELVNPEDANIPQGKIPLSNPIGKSLQGSKKGDEVKVGPTTFKVLKVN
ncbi:MAG: GreA/GreB family elongation factor, partial [Candidatus Poseidoniia archaeon]|nr:GreA/GreB family elongation factor [Candidatus Poseidoniia archaeon]